MPISDLTNFRDLGGLVGAQGKRISPHRLLRSGEIVHVTSSDKNALLNEYGLKCVIDFRTQAERQAQPDDLFDGVRYVPIDLLSDAVGSGPDMQSIMAELMRKEQVDDFMEGAYRLLISEKTAQAGYRTMIELLLERKRGATLNHCSAGKDRTGIATVIILTILGVSKDDIMVDFMRTNEERKLANERIVAMLRQQHLSDTQIKAIELAMYVKRRFLETAYSTANDLFGSFDGYLREGLGVTDEVTKEMRELYLV